MAAKSLPLIYKDDGRVMVLDRYGRERIYGPGPWCGTSNGYRNHRCKCDKCKAWKMSEIKRYTLSEEARAKRAERNRKYRRRQARMNKLMLTVTATTVSDILAIADKVAEGKLTSDEAIHLIVKTYG